jgi:hypothetical protein
MNSNIGENENRWIMRTRLAATNFHTNKKDELLEGTGDCQGQCYKKRPCLPQENAICELQHKHADSEKIERIEYAPIDPRFLGRLKAPDFENIRQ